VLHLPLCGYLSREDLVLHLPLWVSVPGGSGAALTTVGICPGRIWCCTYHCGYLSREDLVLHLLGERVLECEMVPAVDEELVLEVLGRVEVLAPRLLTVAPRLNNR
jgi:hypothetical protein